MLLPDQVRRLIYSRYLLARAGTLQGDGGELASAEALLAVHDSAEILMRVVTDHLGARPAHDFMDFWKNVKDSGHPEPPYRGAMDRVNNLRVGFKHKGNLPHPGVVRDLMPSVTAFCDETVSQYLGVAYTSISLADLVRNSEARKDVKEAEGVCAGGNLPGALLLLGTAYDKLFKEAQEKHRSVLIKQSHWDRMENLYFGKSEQAKQLATALDLKKVMAPLQELIDTVNTLLLGVDTAKFRRFSQLTPTRIYMMSGRMEHAWNRDPSKLTINDFEFCHEFVVNFGIMDQ